MHAPAQVGTASHESASSSGSVPAGTSSSSPTNGFPAARSFSRVSSRLLGRRRNDRHRYGLEVGEIHDLARVVDLYADEPAFRVEDGIDFFHMDALSSAVAMKVDCDLQLTLMASSLYRLLGSAVGNGYERAKSRHIFRDFVDATARIEITPGEIVVRFQKRAHNPLLLSAGLGRTETRIPWLGRRRLRFVFG